MFSKHIYKGYFMVSILFLCNACASHSQSPESVRMEDAEWYHVPNSKLSSDENKMDVYVLRLYPDNTYTLCADLLFETGKWADDETKEARILTPAVSVNNSPSYYLQDTRTPEGKTVFSFFDVFPFNGEPIERAELKAIENKSTFDPYSPAMHRWRKQPVAQETADQIKARVLQYLKFLQALYAHAVDNNIENPGGSWYAQPIRFYSNKVAMAYANELIDWYSCFYNEQDGIEGYKLISGALQKVKIKGEDDVRRNLDCVEQLIANL